MYFQLHHLFLILAGSPIKFSPKIKVEKVQVLLHHWQRQVEPLELVLVLEESSELFVLLDLLDYTSTPNKYLQSKQQNSKKSRKDCENSKNSKLNKFLTHKEVQ